LANSIRNEQLKLTANWFNAVSVAVMTAGALAPAAYMLLDLGTKQLDPINTARAALCCVVISAGLHIVGRVLLGELEHDE
jgi:hypothetical protein